MESAIPLQLQCPRTHPSNHADSYVPPYPAFVARFPGSIQRPVMAYLGLQFKDVEQKELARSRLSEIVGQMGLASGPAHIDIVEYIDESQFVTWIVAAYWNNPQTFNEWESIPSVANWWSGEALRSDNIGYFSETFCPQVTHLETVISRPGCIEGVANLGVGLSDEIQEHGYWGSARDRLPAAQTSQLEEKNNAFTVTRQPGGWLRIEPGQTVTLIRSGKDWGETNGRERKFFLEQVEPVFRKGMEFLRDDGREIGCYFNRYVQHMDKDGRLEEKAFGLSLWRSLADLEHWAKSHPTHVAIFGKFMSMVQLMESKIDLKLYHEVIIAAPQELQFRYLNCHGFTGLLRASSL